MLNGTYLVPRSNEEMTCRICQDYTFSPKSKYKIHTTTLMSLIPFGDPMQINKDINDSIFVNDKDTKIKMVGKIACQNYISTEYIGKFPNFARKGASFIMKCRHGNTNEKYRRFGTDDCMY